MSADETPRRNLGRGLSALLGEESEDYASLDRRRATGTVPIDMIHPSPFQTRRRFDESEMEALVESMREKGVLQPILVRRHPETAEAYQIVAGERRWRAAQRARLHEVPVIIKDLADREVLEISLIENIQREDLSALEEAEGYRRLLEEFSHTQEELARVVGKSRSHVANLVRLLGLPEPVKKLLDSGALTAGHARALLKVGEPEALAREVVRRGLNVRQTERLVQRRRASGSEKRRARQKDADILALERNLSAFLGLKVTIAPRRTGGDLVIRYHTVEQLDDLLQRLSQRGGA